MYNLSWSYHNVSVDRKILSSFGLKVQEEQYIPENNLDCINLAIRDWRRD